jgi:hypothetical protein
MVGRLHRKMHGMKLAGKLINIIMTSSEDLSGSPDAVAESPNTWDLLYKEILIYSMRLREKEK